MIFRGFKKRSRRKSRRGPIFAWLPKRMRSGTWIWLEWYTRDVYGKSDNG